MHHATISIFLAGLLTLTAAVPATDLDYDIYSNDTFHNSIHIYARNQKFDKDFAAKVARANRIEDFNELWHITKLVEQRNAVYDKFDSWLAANKMDRSKYTINHDVHINSCSDGQKTACSSDLVLPKGQFYGNCVKLPWGGEANNANEIMKLEDDAMCQFFTSPDCTNETDKPVTNKIKYWWNWPNYDRHYWRIFAPQSALCFAPQPNVNYPCVIPAKKKGGDWSICEPPPTMTGGDF